MYKRKGSGQSWTRVSLDHCNQRCKSVSRVPSDMSVSRLLLCGAPEVRRSTNSDDPSSEQFVSSMYRSSRHPALDGGGHHVPSRRGRLPVEAGHHVTPLDVTPNHASCRCRTSMVEDFSAARAKHTRSYVAFFPTKRQIPPGRGPVNTDSS